MEWNGMDKVDRFLRERDSQIIFRAHDGQTLARQKNSGVSNETD